MTFKIKKYIYYIFIFVALSFASLWGVQHFFKLSVDFNKLNVSLVVTLIGMILIYVLLDALRFYWILKIMNVHIRYREVIKLAMVGTSVSNITPFLAGGSIAQIYLLHKQNVEIGNATAATSVRAVLASTFFFTILPIVFYFNDGILGDLGLEIGQYLPIISVVYVIWTVAIIVVTFKHERFLKGLTRFSKRFIDPKRAERTTAELLSFFEGMRQFLTSGFKNIAIALLTTSIHFTFIFFFSSAIVKAFGYQYSIFKVAAYQMMVHFVMYFGFTPGATGFAEGSFAYIFSKVVSPDDLALVVFLWRASTVYIVTILGFFILIIEVYRYRTRRIS